MVIALLRQRSENMIAFWGSYEKARSPRGYSLEGAIALGMVLVVKARSRKGFFE